VLVLGLLVFFPAYAADAPRVYKFKYGTTFKAADPVPVMSFAIMDEIEKRSGGRIQIERITGGQLGGPREYLPLLKAGVIQFADHSPAYTPAEMPLGTALNNLYGAIGHNPEEVLRVCTYLQTKDPVAAPLFTAENKAHNIMLLQSLVSPSPYIFISRSEIRTLSDLKGKKVRSYGDIQPKLFGQLDMVPVNVPSAEWYEAMMRGVYDVLPMSLGYIAAYKMQEVGKWLSFDIGCAMYSPLYMNIDAFKTLPPDLQEIIQKMITSDFGTQKILSLVEPMNAKATDEIKAADATWVKVDPKDQAFIYKKCEDTWLLWIEDMKKRGVGERATKLYERWQVDIKDVRAGKIK
jgi:TRAP-type C4-dicarboxylate transport system substrate-binding protein